MKLSIVIVNYNTKELLGSCLRSIAANPPAFPHEVIVVDNGSSDGSRQALAAFPAVKTLCNETNLGYARANNVGIKMAVGEYILLLNSDTIVPPGSLEKMIAYLDANKNVGVLGPKLTGPGGEILQISWDFVPTIFWENVRKALSPNMVRRFPFLRHLIRFLQRTTSRVPVIIGAALLVRRKVFDQAGLLDESFFLYFEEPDLCLRAAKSGWDIVFFPEATIIHLIGESMGKAGNMPQVQYRKSQLYFYDKHRPRIERYLLRKYLFLKYAYTAAKPGSGEILSLLNK